MEEEVVMKRVGQLGLRIEDRVRLGEGRYIVNHLLLVALELFEQGLSHGYFHDLVAMLMIICFHHLGRLDFTTTFSTLKIRLVLILQMQVQSWIAQILFSTKTLIPSRLRISLSLRPSPLRLASC